MSRLTVMIVDDSLIMVQKLSAMLADLGHQVVRVCKSGPDAIRDYPFVKPDLVTMDITMGDMDGIAATAAIVKQHPEARIIMVTALGQEAMVVRALETGALGYVLKPVAKEKLAAMAERAMAQARPSRH
jgi:two-component system, chemotaxis family, chemotaxis protein CheY